MTDAFKRQTKTEIVSQSIEVVRRRIDELGTKEPSIEQQGKDRIVVQVPGLRIRRSLSISSKPPPR